MVASCGRRITRGPRPGIVVRFGTAPAVTRRSATASRVCSVLGCAVARKDALPVPPQMAFRPARLILPHRGGIMPIDVIVVTPEHQEVRTCVYFVQRR